MKKILILLFPLISITLILYLIPRKVQGFYQVPEVGQPDACDWKFENFDKSSAPPFLTTGIPGVGYDFGIKISYLLPTNTYELFYQCHDGGPWGVRKITDINTNSLGAMEDFITFSFPTLCNDNLVEFKVHPKDNADPNYFPCQYFIEGNKGDFVQPIPSAEPTPQYRADCSLTVSPPSGITETNKLLYQGYVTKLHGFDEPSTVIQSVRQDCTSESGVYVCNDYYSDVTVKGNNYSTSFKLSKTGIPRGTSLYFEAQSDRTLSPGDYEATAKIFVTDSQNHQGTAYCSVKFNVCADGDNRCKVIASPTPTITPKIDPFCRVCGGPGNTAYPCEHERCSTCPQCKVPVTPEPLPTLAKLCEQVHPDFQPACRDCMVNKDGKYGRTGIWTAVGCISTDLGGFVTEFIYGIGLKFAGAIAFLYFLYGAFLFLTSGGNPEKVAMGKEVIVSSLSGLLLLIFSLFLLKIIAIDILEIPDFVP